MNKNDCGEGWNGSIAIHDDGWDGNLKVIPLIVKF